MIEEVNLNPLRADRTWDLEILARPYVLWGKGVDGCPIGSPVFDRESKRIFFATPRNPSETVDGHRPEVILGVRTDSFAITDLLGEDDWPLERTAIVLASRQQLLVSQRSFERQPGIGNGSVRWLDIAVPGKPRLAGRIDGVSFTETAFFFDGTVWDENRAIRFTASGPVQEVLELNALLGDSRGAPLLPYTAVDPRTANRFLASQLYESFHNYVLFSLPERSPKLSYVIGTLLPRSVKVVHTEFPFASVHLISGGRYVLAVEKVQTNAQWRNTGRLTMTNTDSLVLRSEWQAARIQAEGIRYLCERDGLLLFGMGSTLLVVREGSSSVFEVPLATKIDRYTRCIPSTP